MSSNKPTQSPQKNPASRKWERDFLIFIDRGAFLMVQQMPLSPRIDTGMFALT
jgi:hypothetical protein